MKKSTQNWIKIAKRDLKVALDNLSLGNYTTTVEKCHSALEKLLKAIITEQDLEPSKIHNLLKLMSDALITNHQESTTQLLIELNTLFMSSWYPDDIDELDKTLTIDRVSRILNETKRIFIWLEEKLK